jgi:hypothetical protein
VALSLLAACDDTSATHPASVTAPAKATGAAPASLNVPREVAFLTRQCLDALEAKAKTAPNLSANGYTSSRGWQEKITPVQNKHQLYLSGPTVQLKYSPGRGKKGNKCYVEILLGPNSDRSRQAWSQYTSPIIAASKEAARAAGYTLTTTKKPGLSPSSKLKKGGTTIRPFGKTEVRSGFRKMQFIFTDLTGSRFAE